MTDRPLGLEPLEIFDRLRHSKGKAVRFWDWDFWCHGCNDLVGASTSAQYWL